ncbi:hypothetical protein ACXIU3_24115, partial [Vibrio parahaemolyticus]
TFNFKLDNYLQKNNNIDIKSNEINSNIEFNNFNKVNSVINKYVNNSNIEQNDFVTSLNNGCENQNNLLMTVIKNYSSVFSKNKYDIGS